MTLHELGIMASLISIVASVVGAKIIRNWRHPIMLTGLLSIGIVVAIAADVQRDFVNPVIDVQGMVEQRFKELQHARINSRTDADSAFAASHRTRP